MILTIILTLLVLNIIGLFNRKRVWSKIFMMTQIACVGGMIVMFNIQTSQAGIKGLEAGKGKRNQHSNELRMDTMDNEKNTQGSQRIHN